MFFNVGKTEPILLVSATKQPDSALKIKPNAKRLYEVDTVKYLGIQIYKNRTWKRKTDHMALKVNKANFYCQN